MTKLLIIRGASGSGKTTLAREFMKKGIYQAHHEADMYVDYNVSHDRRNYRAAHEHCLAEVKKSLRRNHNTIVSNTFIQRWTVNLYIQMIKDLGMSIDDVEIKICSGTYANVHGVPDDAVKRMRGEFEQFNLDQWR